MSLQAITEKLLDDPEIAEKLRLADMYIRLYNENPKVFVLPRRYIELKDIIEAFALDLDKFVKYLRACRDSVVPQSQQYRELHELYRTINLRRVQQQRRDRLDQAWAWYERRNPKAPYDQKVRWRRKLEQQWGKRRMAALAEARRSTTNKRLSLAEMDDILAEFWAEIQREITEGKLPE